MAKQWKIYEKESMLDQLTMKKIKTCQQSIFNKKLIFMKLHQELSK